MRQAAVEALDNLGWKPDQSEAGATYWILKHKWDRCVEISTSAVEPLIAALKYEKWQDRKAAAETLGQIKDARAVEPLGVTLREKTWQVRYS